jgi:hypothetical protein
MAEPVESVSLNQSESGISNTTIASLSLLFIIILSVVYLNYFAGFQPENEENPYGPNNPNKNVAFGGARILQTINHDKTLSL